MSTRRTFFQNAAAFSAALFGLSDQLKAQTPPPLNERFRHTHAEDISPGPRVVTPDVPDLPFELDGNVKVFRLTSEVVKRKIAPFKTIDAWGYNGSCPGPDNPDQSGRPRPRHFRKSPARIHHRSLARPRNSHRAGRRPVDQPKTDPARRKIHIRIHGPSGRNILLSRAQRHAGNARPDRAFHRSPRKGL